MNENNPVGLKAIDHLEFTCDSLSTQTAIHFSKLGFQRTQLKTGEQELYTQGQIRFLLNANRDESTQSAQYFKKHGEGVCKISFRVEDVEKSLEVALKRGGELVQDIQVTETEFGLFKTACIKGFGDVLNEFVQRPNEFFRPGFTQFENDDRFEPLDTRVSRIDHFTNNVPKGEMEHWVDFYKRVYGFKETRYFDIRGVKTGLLSKVVQLADNSIIIPINEPDQAEGKSQIQEYLDRHNGAGVQHIALMTPDIISTIGQLKQRDFKFLDVPGTYYEAIPERPFKVTEDLKVLEDLSLLVDGDKDGYLLQIFTDTYIGPLFFEFIQRKNHWGFGEGNFQALFDSIERDQARRGYI
jgi:4-hydroxyphenylpyruvate dioxygenase